MKIIVLILSLGLGAPGFGLASEDVKVFQRLEKHLKGQSDIIRRTVKRTGDQTIEIEGFISTELNLALSGPILGEFAHYNRWALKDINKKPDGGEYMLQLLSALPDSASPHTLNLKFALDVPLFRSVGIQPFKMGAEQREGYLELTAEAVKRENSVIDWAHGTAKIFPAPNERNRVWVYFIGRMRVRPWLMYEALPDRLLNRLVSNRIKTFLDNLLEQQDKKVLGPSVVPRAMAAEK